MGTSRDVGEFVHKIDNMAKATGQANREIVSRGALLMKEIVLSEAAARGVNPAGKIAGAKWGVRYDVKGYENASALVRVLGPLHLVDRDTKPHKIYRKGQRAKGRGSGRINKQAMYNELFGGVGAYNGGALKLPDGNFRRVVNHPGTKGKGIWAAAKTKAEIAVPRVMAGRMKETWKQALK